MLNILSGNNVMLVYFLFNSLNVYGVSGNDRVIQDASRGVPIGLLRRSVYDGIHKFCSMKLSDIPNSMKTMVICNNFRLHPK